MRFDDVSTAIKPLKPEPIYVHADLGGADTRIEQSRPTMAWRYCDHAGTGPNILEVGVRTAPTRCTKGAWRHPPGGLCMSTVDHTWSDPRSRATEYRARSGSALDTIGNTPLVPMTRLSAGTGVSILLKLEYFNPTGSYKDRMALAMVEQAERRGEITPGSTTIVEYTGGSTGSSLSF